jgi:hypothetical protein
LCLVNNTHPAAAQFVDNFVVRDDPADHWRESYPGETGKSTNAELLATLNGWLSLNRVITSVRRLFASRRDAPAPVT